MHKRETKTAMGAANKSKTIVEMICFDRPHYNLTLVLYDVFSIYIGHWVWF